MYFEIFRKKNFHILGANTKGSNCILNDGRINNKKDLKLVCHQL